MNATRVVVIGGSGHIGSYLTPRLVEAGHQVLCVSRSQREPYVTHEAWQYVERVNVDRKAEEAAGTFGSKIRHLAPDVVMDLTCYELESARQLVTALQGRVREFIHCGTIWVHGPSFETPVTEAHPRYPIDDYGRRKAAIEEYLLTEARQSGFPASILHPGHLVGPGWAPLNPVANFNSQIFADLAGDTEIVLPNLGQETVHHVHADDVAQAFVNAMANPAGAIGESFHVVSPAAVTLADYARATATWFGKEARIRFAPWQEWRASVSENEARTTWSHIVRSPNCCVDKGRLLLGYQPRYSSLEALQESVLWLFSNGLLGR